jgi:hypothetical protein
MFLIRLFTRFGLALAALVMFAGVSFNAQPANAVVYCKTVGVPKGCVARPVVRPHRVVYCKTVGAPKGCVVRPAVPATAVVVATPARRAVVRPRHVVYCKTRGVPKGCVMR